MTSPLDILRNHVDFNIWATRRLLDAAEVLSPEQRERDFGTADRSVTGTLLHLYRSEHSWLQRMPHNGLAEAGALPDQESWEAVRSGWPVIHQQWRTWINSLEDEDVDRVIEFADSKGHPRAEPTWQIVLHLVNHSTHHRGQVMGFLRALGTTPPPLDFTFFVRQKAAGGGNTDAQQK